MMAQIMNTVVFISHLLNRIVIAPNTHPTKCYSNIPSVWDTNTLPPLGCEDPNEMEPKYFLPFCDRLCCCLPNETLYMMRCKIPKEDNWDVNEVMILLLLFFLNILCSCYCCSEWYYCLILLLLSQLLLLLLYRIVPFIMRLQFFNSCLQFCIWIIYICKFKASL